MPNLTISRVIGVTLDMWARGPSLRKVFTLRNAVQAISIVIGVVFGVWALSNLPFSPPDSLISDHESWWSLAGFHKLARAGDWYIFVWRALLTVLLLGLASYVGYCAVYFLVAAWTGVPAKPFCVLIVKGEEGIDKVIRMLATVAILLVLIMLSLVWLIFAIVAVYWGGLVLGKRMSRRWSRGAGKETG